MDMMMMMSQNYEYTALHTESSKIRSVGTYSVTSVTGPAMTQGSKSFWDWAIAVQAKNSLLLGVDSHLADDKLRHRLEAGMEERLARKCDSEKLEKVVPFKKWLDEVKLVDEALRADRAEFQNIAKHSCEAGRRNNALNDQPRRYNVSTSATQPSSSTRVSLPKLTEAERKLLFDNSSCLKCRRFFQSHVSTTCPNDFPNPATYHTLTQANVDAAANRRLQKPKPKIVAAVAENNETPSPSPTHPVAIVMGSSCFPVAYMPSNESNVLDEDSESNSSGMVSNMLFALSAAVLESRDSHDSDQLKAVRPSALPPFHEPHLIWRCSMSGAKNSFPIMFDALIDHGSHAVLVREDFVDSLALRRRKLPVPETVELAMRSGGQKVLVELTHWVKLKLHDPSNHWTAKTVRAIVTPGLCAPVILGLPFLVHNNIVIDHAARTVIDKTSNFDLLNPVGLPLAPPPKKKLKEFFLDLKENCELMVAELKMVCTERKCITECSLKPVKPVDIVAAVCGQIEVLAAQEHLQKLGQQVITEFVDVFAPIPHIDDLPSDVYC
jgi:Aspartyl protease